MLLWCGILAMYLNSSKTLNIFHIHCIEKWLLGEVVGVGFGHGLLTIRSGPGDVTKFP